MTETSQRTEGAGFNRLIRRPEVLALTGLSTSSVYRLMASGEFPRPRRIGSGSTGAVAWRLHDIERWMDQLPIADPHDVGSG